MGAAALPGSSHRACSGDKPVRQCIDAGFDGHLLKPVTFSHLEELIVKLAGGTKSATEVGGLSGSA
jgi:hypothetical protein